MMVRQQWCGISPGAIGTVGGHAIRSLSARGMVMSIPGLAALVLLLLGLSACAPFGPYRTDVSLGYTCAVDAAASDGGKRPLCERPDGTAPDAHAVQHRHYTRSDGPKEVDTDRRDYYMAFVEFDDQGWFADRRQMDSLFTLLESLRERPQEVLIHVYAHGWKHNASACDSNVVCFSRLLERTDLLEKKIFNEDSKRVVVGVYLGWRGLPFDSALNNLSFWSRKAAAERVGRGSVLELLTRLRDYRDSRQRSSAEGAERTQLVVTGHSFGGLVIYSALSHAITERAAHTVTGKGKTRYDVARSFGDFVLLVNPAFEGSLYEPLFDIAVHRCYPDRQRPVMMIVTSEADSATRIAFPIGRALDTLFQHASSPEQADAMRKTVGHDPRYITHRLESDGVAQEKKNDEPCGCPNLDATVDWSAKGVTKIIPRVFNQIDPNRSTDSQMEYGDMLNTDDAGAKKPDPLTLRRDQGGAGQGSHLPAHLPFLVVQTDRGVIADHNAIYSERFVSFTQLFLQDQIFSRRMPAKGAQAVGGDGETDGSCAKP